MFKADVPSTHHATNATWSKRIAFITQHARIGNPNRPGILEIITNWPEGENFGLMDEEEQEQVTRAEEAPPYNQLPAEETRYALFTDGSCRVVGMNRKWKAAVWSPTQQAAQATEGEGGSSQFAELKAVQLALDIAEREKWPKLYLYTDLWMVANALWGWLEKWKKANWQRRGKPIWAADEWKDIATRVEKLPVKVRHVDAHVPKSRANEEHRNNEQVDQAAKIEVSKIDLDWQHKGELFLARWARDASGHQGRDATYKWARDRGVDLTMDSISQVIHDCETCAAIKQAKRVKPLWYGGRWSKYKYGEAWQIDYITLPQTRQGKRYVLTMVEATTGWLETYPVPHATAHNTILGLEKQVLWRHGTPERIESDNGTHFKNSLINNWAREHGIEWVYHIPYHAPASGKVERYNGLLKTTLKALGGGSFKNWEQHLAKATWLVNTRGSTNRAGPAQSESLHTVDGEKVPVVHVRGEKSSDAMKHLIQAFSFLGIPKSIKTDNGPTYTSKEFRSFLQQWGVEHKTGIPYSPTGQAVVERSHQNLKRVLNQQHQSLKLEAPQVQLSKVLFTLNFLICTFENLNPPIVRHFRENCQLQLKAKPPVMVKDPATRETEGPHDLITWGCGYACVSTPSGPKWMPAKWVKYFIPKTAKPPADVPQVASAAWRKRKCRTFSL
ncbi:hypothetical protein DUI87_25705 [Hirundo rustica rustica]|uniref:Uncharacterized protein n=1 Tax=Hirundo rustica rustica TaxID=333673 RepID=A0A3M0JAE5_HIRRU|nr:hypothetical protein DUI87_25705 [Hirundo rustica rustica]